MSRMVPLAGLGWNRRDFIKVGLVGASAVVAYPLLSPRPANAGIIAVPARYLDSTTHGQWMRLTYNAGRESRQTRRIVGIALRNIGALQGEGEGYEFARVFDQAVHEVFANGLKPVPKNGSIFGAVQRLYEESLFPRGGPEVGRILFKTLFFLLRGRDGTDRGEKAHKRYLAYRQATLDYKRVSATSNDRKEIKTARDRKMVFLDAWRREVEAMAESYALRETALSDNPSVGIDMLEGFEIRRSAHDLIQARRLAIAQSPDGVSVFWSGSGTLETAPSLDGPWTPTQQRSPARFQTNKKALFFRLVHESNAKTQAK